MVSKICSAFIFIFAFLDQEMWSSAQSVTNVCSESIETGQCKAAFKRYAYSSTDNRCVSFVYGGCGANGNNFENRNKCLSACKPDCIQPLQVDKCSRASKIRYGYNPQEEKCVEFAYGGSEQNPNNFETIEKCRAQCE
ncbi:tissue factor pathway inhibitor-like [Belonocnema kinseyi]|uniref:tissue factor pathway inhibitor-like n=1 Tax=Belonocnema kinseyi TaxID=2817044 RepID=UPI00143DB3FC|nr:tissue factor pathway inhibitor-like [Belonocnema kinseyi]